MSEKDPEVVDLLLDDEEESDLEEKKRDAAEFGTPQKNPAAKRVKTEKTSEGETVYCIDQDSDEDTVMFGLESRGMPAVAGEAAAACLDPRLSTVYGGPEDDDEDVEEVSGQAFKTAAAVNMWTSDDEEKKEDDDIALVSTTGHFALIDFPHSRENCVTHPHSADPSRHCANCYCYVCDIPAKDCESWQQHCRAKHGDAQWRSMREQHRFKDSTAAAPQAQPAPRAALPPAQPRLISTFFSVRRRRAPRRAPRGGGENAFSIQALLDAVTSVHPVEKTPPAALFQTDLRHYQRQSLAFMMDVEGQTTSQEGQTLGGWLCDEVGMGKSAVVIALVAANPMPVDQRPTLQQIKQVWVDERRAQSTTSDDIVKPDPAKKEIEQKDRVKVKTTVILTSVSLLGQWEDECKKHAPNLKVFRYHGSKRGRFDFKKDLQTYDIIISTTTFKWPATVMDRFEFHRVVCDESHLFSTSASSAKLSLGVKFKSSKKWCVTATPIVSSPSDLIQQLNFLNGNRFEWLGDASEKKFHRSETLNSAMREFSSSRSSKTRFDKFVDELKLVMIRHTKKQRIGGSEALALPASTTTPVYVDMSARERALFGHANQGRYVVDSYQRNGAKMFAIERCFLFELKTALRENPTLQLTKVKALVDDLREMRKTQPNLRAVVFTQYKDVHSAVVEAVKDEMTIYKFDGSTDALARDRAIRKFQDETDPTPAVFAITLRAGNVGITLTAASIVYLMEPCLDPGAEVQAAGRIHRLGQTKHVQVKKLIFKNTVESNIVELHKEIVAGRISIANGFVPPKGVKILAKGVTFRPNGSRF